ncbi:MAG TPA: hypothetical protein VFH03_16775 [Actinoplanes sp.]|nr:hypothetical protein [Actinoplanes sp.]
MTGNVPQPGDKPRNEGEPWAYTDANIAWWRVEEERDEAEAMADAVAARPRHPRRRATSNTPAPGSSASNSPDGDATPAFAPEALDAHAAGVHDVTRQLNPPPAALVEAEQEARIETVEAAAAAATIADVTTSEPVERHHDRKPAERYLPTMTTAGSDVSTADEADHGTDEDVMVLPEPGPNRPTVVLDPGRMPDRPQPAPSLPGQTRPAQIQPAQPRLSEAARDRLENSPFWLTDEERAATGAAGPAAEDEQRTAGGRRTGRPAGEARSPRRPLPGLVALVALALIAAFFSWVSAEPFWLAAGHGDRGTATVGHCAGSGLTQRCTGGFAAGDGSFTVQRVALLGVGPDSRATGSTVPARMVSPDSRQAYVGEPGWMLHLRWVLGFILVLMCGYGVAGMTGARRLETASARRSAVLISVAGPVALLLGFLAATY